MATLKKAKGPSMIETFQEFKETKNIDRTTLVSVLEESFRNVIAKMFGSDENFDVIVNPDKGDHRKLSLTMRLVKRCQKKLTSRSLAVVPF